MSKILLTGSTGFIGKFLTIHLQKEGFEIIEFNKFILGFFLTIVIFFISIRIIQLQAKPVARRRRKATGLIIISEMAGLPGKGGLAFFSPYASSLQGITARSLVVLRRETAVDLPPPIAPA